MRQVVLDTETTGLEPSQGHRVIEIGCVELFNRQLTGNHFHVYINPEREVDEGALAVHGISNEFLADKPLFSAIVEDFLAFIEGAELIIHNAAFDIGFLNQELSLLPNRPARVDERCGVIDTLLMARQKHPGQKNNLDALCKRYGIDNSHRDLHGALLDAEILADVYLRMTGGQTLLSLQAGDADDGTPSTAVIRLPTSRARLRVQRASDAELTEHASRLEALRKSAGTVLWPCEAPET